MSKKKKTITETFSGATINPEGFITAIVQVPCVDRERYGPGSLARLAQEVHLQFGPQAEVQDSTGKLVFPKNT